MNLRKDLIYLVVLMIIIATIAFTLPFLSSSDVVIAYSEKVNYETLMVADAERMLVENGFQTKVVTGGIRAAEALMTGSADMAVMGDGPAVQVITKETGAKIIARFSGGEGIHRFISSIDIVVPLDIEGKTIGLQGSSSTHAAFLRWAEANEVNVSTVTVVFMNPMDIPLAMFNGDIDLMAGSEPWAVNTENLCGDQVHEIGNSSGLGSTFPIVLVASAKIISENPEAIRSLIDIMQRSNEYILENWNESMAICAARTGLSIADQSRCSAVQFFAVGFDQTDVDSIEMAAQAMLDFGSITAMPVVMEHVDLRFLSNT